MKERGRVSRTCVGGTWVRHGGRRPTGWRVVQGGGGGRVEPYLANSSNRSWKRWPPVTFNPFYCMAFALDGLPGQLDIMSIA